ncbi:MAG: hypothetical protein H7318_04270 [Oligoflexus sp.]|nr:hypothetical protein [Oligoflexus sp.]
MSMKPLHISQQKTETALTIDRTIVQAFANLEALAIQHDPDVRVREEASEALTYGILNGTELSAYEQIFFTESDIAILKNVLRALANRGSEDAKKIMQKFSANFGRTEVCGYADSLLRSL